ncbi:MAG: carbamoyltransferase HypF [Deltaproteobacteria bacterium]|nr:MAG: carbamoyltransferase HypF [Deltaproteobacteria bacterium]
MIRAALVARGQVQGVGFRPFVVRTARQLGLTGWVRNEPDGVRAEVQGAAERIEVFTGALRDAPFPAVVSTLERIDLAPVDEVAFELRPSVTAGTPRPSVPPDLATCPTCLAELSDPASPRFGYPLLSCTACGPRYTIAQQLPFDRERTAMHAFPLCERCQTEYEDTEDRRFHAQATVCPDCGPMLRMGTHRGPDAVAAAAALLRDGGLLALKGLGGFQLLCDATHEGAVRRLRQGKRRPDKPLAVLFGTLDELALTTEERALLESPAAPIVLVDGPPLAPSVSDGLPWCGAMRPTTALHSQLAEAVGRPLVCTSGNVSGEPLCRDDAEARAHLDFADAILDHDRPVLRPADDSVARVVAGDTVLLRRARGHAPAPIGLGEAGPTVLAVGAHLKNTVGIAVGDQAVLSPHIGTLGGRRMLDRFAEELHGLQQIYAARPERIACDLHPDLPSTRHAENLATELGVPLFRVQHHHAHVAAVMAEHRLESVLGIAWDGVGYGTDGTTWGAEALRCEGSLFTRSPMVRPFALPGGDACARSPARCALGAFAEADGAEAVLDAAQAHLPKGAGELLRQGLAQGLFPVATSMGRLFDAVAFACGGPGTTTYEAAAAMWLEALALRGIRDGEDGRYAPDTLLEEVLADRAAGAAPERIAARFHHGLVGLIEVTARDADVPDVALAGGCFQNAILLEGALRRLEAAGFRPWMSRQVPPNDGGIALGQLWLARRS